MAAPALRPSTAEAQLSGHASQIRANAAWALGATGGGVTVAVLDTGLTLGHREFAGSGKVAGILNVTDGSSNVADLDGHGTHVAGIIGAAADGAGTVGVAYGAKLLVIKVFDDQSKGRSTWVDAGLRHAIGRASIANLSLGTETAANPTALREAVSAGLLVVAAAGNDGAAHPGWPARYAKESWANGQIIAVGAVDASNTIASFSSRAGDAANFYLVAPGVGIASTYAGGYARVSGTSMAAPVVSGAAAVVKSHWSHLSANQVADILFTTATDLGAPGVDAVYGRGLVNLERALQPIGALSAPTVSGQASAPILGSYFSGSAATSALATAARAGKLKIKALDDVGRAYDVDLGRSVQQAVTPLTLAALVSHADWQADLHDRISASGARFAWLDDSGSASGNAGTRSALWVSPLTDGGGSGQIEIAGASGRLSGHYFGLQGMQLGGGAPSLVGVRSLDNAYLGLTTGGLQLAAGARYRGVQFKAGFVTAAFNERSLQGEPTVLANAAVFEVSGKLGPAVLATSLTQLQEGQSWLGATHGGALALGAAKTTAVQWSGALPVGDRLVLSAQWALGATQTAAGGGNGLATQVSASRTQSFALGALWADAWRDGDRLSLTASQPMRATTGSVTYHLPVEQRFDGSLRYERREVSLVPQGRELLLQSDYAVPVSHADPRLAGRLNFTAGLRLQPGHDAGAKPEAMIGVRYVSAF